MRQPRAGQRKNAGHLGSRRASHNLHRTVSLLLLCPVSKPNSLVPFKDFCLYASLVGLHALHDDELFVLCQEFGLGRRIREEEREEDTCGEGEAGNNNHIDLPLRDLDPICRCLGRSSRDAVRDETGDHLSQTVAREIPSKALGHFNASVKHLVDEHDAWGDAPLCHAEENTHGNWRRGMFSDSVPGTKVDVGEAHE